MGQYFYNEIYTAVSALFCVLCAYQLWVQSRTKSISLMQYAMPRFTIAGAAFFLVSFVITVVYERSYSNALAFACDIFFYVATMIDFAQVFFVIYLSVKNSRHLASMTPDPAVVFRDRVFFIALWLILLVTIVTVQTLMYVRNDISYLAYFYAITALLVMSTLSNMWYSIFQLKTYMEEHSARAAGGNSSSLATFNKTMCFMTFGFSVICVLISYSAYKHLSIGTTPYLPVPIPLEFSPFGSVYLLLWATAIWYAWLSPSGEAEGRLLSSASSQHSSHPSRLAKTNTAAKAGTCDSEHDTVAMTTESMEASAELSAMDVAVKTGVDAPHS
jgi:hypothetical protein